MCNSKVLGSQVVVGFIFDSVVGKRLAPCPFLLKIPFSPFGFPDLHYCWNSCTVDSGHCTFHGRRLLFESHGIDSLKVIWVCPKLVDLSFLGVGVHD
jgi:hypothetical protein